MPVGNRVFKGAALIAAFGTLGLSACASNKSDQTGSVRTYQSQEGEQLGRSFFGLVRRQTQPTVVAQPLGVNAYMWRGALDVLSFMSLASADPYAGIIITDWYAPPEKPDERFKATAYILDTRLRADGLNVTINRQVRGVGGEWTAAATSPQTETEIENAILTKARQLRVNGLG